MRIRIASLVLVALVAPLLCAPNAEGGSGGNVVLDTSGFWRFHFTLRMPVCRDGGKVETFGSECNTEFPTGDWTTPGFDDSSWCRTPGAPFQAWSHWRKDIQQNLGIIRYHKSSPAFALLCVRGKFGVKDPRAASDLSLDIEYRGGVIVYVNGREVARGHMAGGAKGFESLAEDYPAGASRVRKLAGVRIPKSVLRKGANVLAVEVHRAPYDKSVPAAMNRSKRADLSKIYDHCGITSIRLTGGGSSVVPNVTRPAGLQVWNSNPMAPDFDLDFGDPHERLGPVVIVGTRNGAFSGKVVVGSNAAVRNLKAAVGDLAIRGGAGRIPASAVEIRYALPTGSEANARQHYPAPVNRFDALAEKAPAEIPVREKKRLRNRSRLLPGSPEPVYGAVVPVWVTVNVPADARPGDYEGKLTISAQGTEPVEVPVKLKVNAFRLPDPADYRTFVEIIQSPETLALVYKVPLWSERHWALTARSLRLTGRAGAKSCYVPLICQTNQGNAESMVRWAKRGGGGGGYRHDFSVLEKYVDLVVEHQGRPLVVCLYVWDTYCNSKEILVTGADAAGKAETIKLPRYADASSKALWKPVIDGVRERLRRRGLEKTMMFGICTDKSPSAEVVSLFKEIAPDVPWVAHSHGNRGARFGRGAKLGFRVDVWGLRFITFPDGSSQGWKRPELFAHFARDMRDTFPLTTFRLIGEMEIGGELRGFARFGADFWSTKTGGSVASFRHHEPGGATLSDGRFPESSWRNLNIRTALLSASPEGAIATARLEMMREGVQECEARIFIEKALLGKRITGGLAKRCEALITERNRTIFMGLDDHCSEGRERKRGNYNWCCAAGLVGYYWYLSSGWQERSDKLYSTAAEVAAELGGR